MNPSTWDILVEPSSRNTSMESPIRDPSLIHKRHTGNIAQWQRSAARGHPWAIFIKGLLLWWRVTFQKDHPTQTKTTTCGLGESRGWLPKAAERELGEVYGMEKKRMKLEAEEESKRRQEQLSMKYNFFLCWLACCLIPQRGGSHRKSYPITLIIMTISRSTH